MKISKLAVFVETMDLESVVSGVDEPSAPLFAKLRDGRAAALHTLVHCGASTKFSYRIAALPNLRMGFKEAKECLAVRIPGS